MFSNADQFMLFLTATIILNRKLYSSNQNESLADEPTPSLPTIPYTIFSSSRLLLLPYLYPRNPGRYDQRYYSELAEAPSAIQDFIKTHQIPSDSFRETLRHQLYPQFTQIAEILSRDGIAIFPGYIASTQLGAIQKYYQQQLRKFGNRDGFLKQTVFSASSHHGVSLNKAMSEFLCDPFLLSLLSDFAGGEICLSDFRGYRTEPRLGIKFRACNWHHDGGLDPEMKMMILLNDVEPNGGEMLFLKRTARWWKITNQKDANFAMEDALAIAEKQGEPQLTRCYGKAGTVIIFTGECLHTATRSLNQTRDVLVFTYKRNVPGTAFYPIPPLVTSVAKQVQHSFQGKCLRINQASTTTSLGEANKTSIDAQAIKVANDMIIDEQDIKPGEIESLLQKYNETATLSSAKMRFWNRDNLSPYHFIAHIFRTDVHHDLDLIIRDNEEDMLRDVLRIRMREYKNDSLAMKRLNKRCQEINLAPSRLPDISQLQEWLMTICDLEMSPSSRLIPAVQLAKDLIESLSHCDEVQDLRTNIAFIYLIYDYVHDELGITNESISDKRLKDILNTYAAIVMIDDHHFENGLRKSIHGTF